MSEKRTVDSVGPKKSIKNMARKARASYLACFIPVLGYLHLLGICMTEVRAQSGKTNRDELDSLNILFWLEVIKQRATRYMAFLHKILS